MPRSIVLLGPQRHQPTVKDALADLSAEAPVALVTAGWEERESEDDELRQHLGRPAENLRLYERVEEVFRVHPKFHRAMQETHERLGMLRDLYRVRLDPQLEAARRLLRGRKEPGDLLSAEQEDAIEMVRVLDHRQQERVRDLLAEFREDWPAGVLEELARQRAEVDSVLVRCPVVAIAGGHVAVLFNRLRTLGGTELLTGKHLVAWSAGAMILARTIVLFHDNPPQGFGNPEVLEAGLGLVPGVLPLPHAHHRLRLNDPVRVALFARRFAPDRCIPLDPGDRIAYEDGALKLSAGTRTLDSDGRIVEESGT